MLEGASEESLLQAALPSLSSVPGIGLGPMMTSAKDRPCIVVKYQRWQS